MDKIIIRSGDVVHISDWRKSRQHLLIAEQLESIIYKSVEGVFNQKIGEYGIAAKVLLQDGNGWKKGIIKLDMIFVEDCPKEEIQTLYLPIS